jgi:hypothetical protein
MKITAFVLRVCYIEPKSYTSYVLLLGFATISIEKIKLNTNGVAQDCRANA